MKQKCHHKDSDLNLSINLCSFRHRSLKIFVYCRKPEYLFLVNVLTIHLMLTHYCKLRSFYRQNPHFDTCLIFCCGQLQNKTQVGTFLRRRRNRKLRSTEFDMHIFLTFTHPRITFIGFVRLFFIDSP